MYHSISNSSNNSKIDRNNTNNFTLTEIVNINFDLEEA